jgi:hypothetical protein
MEADELHPDQQVQRVVEFFNSVQELENSEFRVPLRFEASVNHNSYRISWIDWLQSTRTTISRD